MADGIFNRDHAPPIGRAEELGEGIRVVTAGNGGPMTFTGTRTYIVGEGEVAVIDPGPADPAHLDAILAALAPGERVSHILVTHSHLDHSPLARPLAERTGAPVIAFGDSRAGRSAQMDALAASGAHLGGGEGIDAGFAPDIAVADGEDVAGRGWSLRALHTPGHLSNHLAFGWDARGAVFSGDHVMGWATTLVSPPDGDLSAFMSSLERMRGQGQVFYPGHGAPLEVPDAMIDHQLAHRRGREAQILAALADGEADIAALTARIYADVDPVLHPAAARNVFAHLIDLVGRGLVEADGGISRDARFARLQG
ncbi:MAG: MBL fold metallo-hydrolase [Pseudomonadota bacterium]